MIWSGVVQGIKYKKTKLGLSPFMSQSQKTEPSLRSEAAVKSGSTTADTSVSIVLRWP